MVSRRDVKRTHEQVSRSEKNNIGEDNIGKKLLEGMGWRQEDSDETKNEAFETALVNKQIKEICIKNVLNFLVEKFGEQ